MTSKISFFLLLIFFSGCELTDYADIRAKYPFFENAEIKAQLISLNNFNKNGKRRGMEYLLDKSGRLVRIQQWKDGKREGYQFLYTASQKLNYLVNFSNDTINGDYFVIDTISGKISEYREVLSQRGVTVDNQIIRFVEGKVDMGNSSFIKIQAIGDGKYRIHFFAGNRLPFLAAYVHETDSVDVDHSRADGELEILSEDNQSILYEVRNRHSKFVIGYLLNYRFPTESECIERGLSKDQKLGPLTYFKIELR